MSTDRADDGHQAALGQEAALGREAALARELSAGGVVVDGDRVVVIVPRRRAADGSRVLGLPKGHLDPGETPLDAAIREVREEAGVEVEHVAWLGEVRYSYTWQGRQVPKTVGFHLFRYVAGDLSDHDSEVEEASWLPLREAAEALTYPGEREVIARAIDLIEAREVGDGS